MEKDIEIKGLDKETLNPHGYGGMCSRQAVIRAAEKDFKNGIDTIATTEQPAIVVDWERFTYVREVLPMKYCVLPETDKTVLLDSHSRVSIEKVKGSAKNWHTEGSELRAKLFISSTEEKLIQNIKEEHIDSVSIGYETSKEYTVEIPKGAEVTIDGAVYRNDFDDDIPFLVRTWWKIKELSLVPIGADDKAKLRAELLKEMGIKADDPELQKKLDEVLKGYKNIEEQIKTITIKGGDTLEPKDKEKNEPSELTEEQKRQAEDAKIEKFASERFDGKFRQFAETAKGAKLSYDQFAAMVFDKIEEKGSAVETPSSFLDLTEKQRNKYSISRAVDVVLKGKHKNLPDSENASFEFECSKAVEQRFGKGPQRGTIYLPYDIRQRHYAQRAHSTSAGQGGEFIATDLRSDLMPDFLRNDVVLGRLGATIITGLRDNLEIPKMVSSLTVQSVAENGTADTSYITTGKLSASPHNITANTEYGRQWFYQSSIDVDNLLMNELDEQKNVKIDYLCLNGSGEGNEPTGYFNLSGITDIEMTAPTWRKILSFAKTIKKANAYRGSFKWLMSPDVEQETKATEKFASTGRTLLENNLLDGMGYEWSNQVGDQVLTLANWSEAYMLFWGMEELLIDPFTKSTQGMVRLSIFTMMDFLFRQTQAAAIADDYALAS